MFLLEGLKSLENRKKITLKTFDTNHRYTCIIKYVESWQNSLEIIMMTIKIILL